MRVWTLKRAAESAVRHGYPWVFSNQLAHSPKDSTPGEPIELRDFAGHWVAQGYGHPHSLISFRTLSLSAQERDVGQPGFFLRRLARASELRMHLGMGNYSHRLCFAEADGIPGLIVDRYRLQGSPAAQVLVVESSTAGMDRCLPAVLEALEALVAEEATRYPDAPSWTHTGVLVDQGGTIRHLEELAQLPKAWHRQIPVDGAKILAAMPARGTPLPFEVDLLEGQKTGFFLDQSYNLELAERLLVNQVRSRHMSKVRILDLFCYVGQWSARLAAALRQEGVACEVLAVDASQKALTLAQRNIAFHGGDVQTTRLDIVEQLHGLNSDPFDVIVCDPPALVKRRKELPKSVRAYQKLNREALRLMAPGGLLFSCSCSGLLDEDAFRDMLGHASYQAQRQVRWVARGGQAADHPVLAVFPEGRYLKFWAGIAD